MSRPDDELPTGSAPQKAEREQTAGRTQETAEAAHELGVSDARTGHPSDSYNQRDEWNGPFYGGGTVSYYE